MLNVLVVDDDPTTVAFLAGLLRGEGCSVQTAADGAEGLKKAGELVPDILITDLDMPRMSGNQLVAALGADTRLSAIYRIVLTVHGEKADKMKSLLSGADDFVAKPAKPEEIVGRIEIAQRVLHAREESRQAARRAARPDAASVAALGAILARIRDLAVEAEAASGRDPAGVKRRCHEITTAAEQARRALQEPGPP